MKNKDRTTLQTILVVLSIITLMVMLYVSYGAMIHLYNGNIVSGAKLMIPSALLFIMSIWFYKIAYPKHKIWDIVMHDEG